MSELDPVSVPVQQIRAEHPGVALDSLVRQLDANRLAVFEGVVGGLSVADAAEMAGVGRSTAFGWMRADPPFKAAIEAWKAEQREVSLARLTKMTDKAVGNVEKALDSGDAKLSYSFLKDRGLLAKEKPGPSERVLLRNQIAIELVNQCRLSNGRGLLHLLTEAGLPPEEQRRLLTEALQLFQVEDRP